MMRTFNFKNVVIYIDGIKWKNVENISAIELKSEKKFEELNCLCKVPKSLIMNLSRKSISQLLKFDKKVLETNRLIRILKKTRKFRTKKKLFYRIAKL